MMLAVTEKGAAGVYAQISEKVWISGVISVLFRSRTPHGVRGLKWHRLKRSHMSLRVAPRMGRVN